MAGSGAVPPWAGSCCVAPAGVELAAVDSEVVDPEVAVGVVEVGIVTPHRGDAIRCDLLLLATRGHCSRFLIGRRLRRSGGWGRGLGRGRCGTLSRRRAALILCLRRRLTRSVRAHGWANGCSAENTDEKNDGQSHTRDPNLPDAKPQSYFMPARKKTISAARFICMRNDDSFLDYRAAVFRAYSRPVSIAGATTGI